MDLASPWLMLSSLFISLAGSAIFLYGKKQQSLRFLGTGLVMCVFPYFVTSMPGLWGTEALIVGGLYGWGRLWPE